MKEKILKLLRSRPRVGCYLALLPSLYFLWPYPWLLTAVLALLGFIMILSSPRPVFEFWLYVLSGLIGAFSEGLAVAGGAWSYSRLNFLYVPTWLPLLWGLGALFVNRIGEKLQSRGL